MHKNGTDKYELARASFCRAACKMQGALGIDIAIQFYRVLFMRMMHARCKLDDGVCSAKCVLPVGRRANRLDYHLVIAPGRTPHGSTNCPSLPSQRWREMTGEPFTPGPQSLGRLSNRMSWVHSDWALHATYGGPELNRLRVRCGLPKTRAPGVHSYRDADRLAEVLGAAVAAEREERELADGPVGGYGSSLGAVGDCG